MRLRFSLLLTAIFILFLSPGLFAQSVPQETLFPNLRGQELLDALADSYTPDNVLSYNGSRDLMFTILDNDEGTVYGIYTGYEIPVDPNSNSPRSDAFMQGINTENIWPQSKGAGSAPMRGDLHHLRPSRIGANGSRASFPFAFIPDANVQIWWLDDVSQTFPPDGDRGLWSRTGSGTFQPRDSEKGYVARAMFYFYTIYTSQADAADPNFFNAQHRQALRSMHNDAPVSSYEYGRTLGVEDIQGNVNPFIVDTTLVRRAFWPDDYGPGPVPGEDYLVDFEDAQSQNGYTSELITLNGSTWLMSNALIGNDANDLKEDQQSARMRWQTSPDAEETLLEMRVDMEDGIGEISFLYGRSDFPGDRDAEAPAFVVELSTNGGQSWQQYGPEISLEGIDELTSYSVAPNVPEESRMRIRAVSGSDGRRFNIDDILITPFVEDDGSPRVVETQLEGMAGWRFVAAPVQELSLGELFNPFWTQGAAGGDMNIGQPNLFTLDNEANYSAIPDYNQPAENAQGYLFYVFDLDDITDPDSGGFPKPWSVEGPTVIDDVSVELNSGIDAFTLLGNPFTVPLDFGEVLEANPGILSDVVYVYDHAFNGGSENYDEDFDVLTASGGYRSWNGFAGGLGGYTIAPFQAFLVQSEVENATITIPASARRPGEYAQLHEEDNTPPTFRLRAQINGEQAAEIMVSIQRDYDEPSADRKNMLSLLPMDYKPFIHMALREEGSALQFKYLPVSFLQKSWPIQITALRPDSGAKSPSGGPFEPFTGEVELTWEISDGFFIGNEAWGFSIKDTFTGESIDLSRAESLTFTYEGSDALLETAAAMQEQPQLLSPPYYDGSSSRFELRMGRIWADIGDGETPERPAIIELSQNYPNPFNPATEIAFNLPEAAEVRLDVFSINGQQVASLADERMSAGTHQLRFDAGNLASGVYLYRLQTPTETITRKMTLLK
jgi:endonuclease I